VVANYDCWQKERNERKEEGLSSSKAVSTTTTVTPGRWFEPCPTIDDCGKKRINGAVAGAEYERPKNSNPEAENPNPTRSHFA